MNALLSQTFGVFFSVQEIIDYLKETLILQMQQSLNIDDEEETLNIIIIYIIAVITPHFPQVIIMMALINLHCFSQTMCFIPF